MTEPGRQAFQRYIRAGSGWVGILGRLVHSERTGRACAARRPRKWSRAQSPPRRVLWFELVAMERRGWFGCRRHHRGQDWRRQRVLQRSCPIIVLRPLAWWWRRHDWPRRKFRESAWQLDMARRSAMVAESFRGGAFNPRVVRGATGKKARQRQLGKTCRTLAVRERRPWVCLGTLPSRVSRLTACSSSMAPPVAAPGHHSRDHDLSARSLLFSRS